jgi:hypothetical protein
MTAKPDAESESSAEILVGPWRRRTGDNRPNDATKLQTAMCTSPGHRSDTGISLQLLRIPILSAAESRVVMDLLSRLADNHDDEIGDLALDMAGRLRAGLGLYSPGVLSETIRNTQGAVGFRRGRRRGPGHTVLLDPVSAPVMRFAHQQAGIESAR